MFLATLPAFTSRTLLVVIPSIYLVAASPTTTTALLRTLHPNPDEVDQIFHAPLHGFLGLGSPTYEYSYEDFIWLEERTYRLHQFEHPSFAKAVTGLTADIVVYASLIAYWGLSSPEDENSEQVEKDGTRRLGFKRAAEGQMSWREIVSAALRSPAIGHIRRLRDARTVEVEA